MCGLVKYATSPRGKLERIYKRCKKTPEATITFEKLGSLIEYVLEEEDPDNYISMNLSVLSRKEGYGSQ